MHVVLSRYADVVAGGEDVGLLRYIAAQVSRRTPEPVTSGQLREWLRQWPWFLVLDGLDEVAAPPVREHLADRISEFMVEAADVDADLLILATSRPQGYGRDFRFADYEHLQLRDLTPDEATRYAVRLAAVRHPDDPDDRDRLLRKVKAVAANHHTSRLMRTPLQVTIMSVLLERQGRVPQDRYGLFESYYRVAYDREVAKETPVAAFLDQQRTNIDALHAEVGLMLQQRAETAGEAEAVIGEEELTTVAVARLQWEGYAADEATDLACRIVEAATDRLVLLVGRTPGRIGYEIRSLQEFMAARRLTDDTDDGVIEHLRQRALSAHWRNTWLFAAGRIFRHRQHLRDAVVALLVEIDSQDRRGLLLLPGTRLACDLIGVDIAADAPRYRRLLVQHALGALNFFPGPHVDALGWMLLDAAAEDPAMRTQVEVAIRRALDGSGRTAVAAAQLLAQISRGQNGPLAAACRQTLARALATPPTPLAATASDEHHTLNEDWLIQFGKEARKRISQRPDNESLLQALPRLKLDSSTEQGIRAALRRPGRLTMNVSDGGRHRDIVDAVLTLAFALPPGNWLPAAVLAHAADEWVMRQQIDGQVPGGPLGRPAP